jgi:SAM-dependent methyltransferase
VLRSHLSRRVDNSAAYLIPHLSPGLKILDVGCGPGTITTDLAARVAPGTVIGIDASADVVAQAAELAERATSRSPSATRTRSTSTTTRSTSSTRTRCCSTSATRSPLSREWRRVTKPGGIVAARDGDYSAFTWYPADPLLDRWNELYHQLTRRNDAEADAGRFLLSWAQHAGFTDVTFTSSTWTWADPETREWWGGLWADRVLESSFATQTVEYGLSTRDELEAIAAAWRSWAQHDDATYIVPHGEIVARK